MTEDLSKPTIIMGVTGGIAAAKSTLLASRLNKAGFDVRVIMTPNATKFVSELTFRSLTGNKVVTDMFEEPEEWDIRHVSLAKKARLAVICPATANFIGKAANGIADDMLTTTIMALGCPVVVAPAMNDAMWANDAVQANVLKLKGLGYVFAGPVTGRLACGTEGLGRMAEPDAIFDVVMHSYLAIGRSSLKGVKLLVSAGPTVEPIDPVRYIANRSSGKMGYALALAAAARGAEVTLVSGPTALPDPLNVEVKRVDTAEQMLKALEDGFERCDAFVATAAVADYRAKEYSDRKIKKEKAGIKALELVENPDILAKLSSMKGGRLMVGFAAETEDAIESALGKYSKKGLDMIVVNEVNERNQPFGAEDNIVSIITGKGEVESLPRMSKSELSHMILDRISELMA